MMLRVPALLASAMDRVTTERRLEFEAAPHGWPAVAGVAGALALVWAVVWLYRREGRAGASMRRRLVMAALRCLVLLILIGIWIEPVVATYLTRWVESYCLVLIDTSASMDLPDEYRDAERAERVTAVLDRPPEEPVRRIDLVQQVLSADDHRFLKRLAEHNAVKLYSFDESLQPIATLNAQRSHSGDEPDSPFAIRHSPLPPARGGATNVVRAVQRAVHEASGAPLSGVVIFTDGGFTDDNPFDSLASIAREHELPLHLVGVGDPSEPRNVRVVQVTAPDTVLEADPFEITAHIQTAGYLGRTITVHLYERTADGTAEATRVETRRVAVDREGALEPLIFTRAGQRVGRRLYRIEVPSAGYESVTDDNSRQTAVNVVDSRVRVLLVAGAASWEYRYLSRLLVRDDSFEVTCWLQSADARAVRDGNTTIDRLPSTAEELFAYDAVVLLDPDPEELDRAWCELVARLVGEHGAGLLYAAARLHTPALVHDLRLQPLLALLPVTLDPEADLILNRIGHYQQQPWPMIVPEASAGHPALRMADDPAGNRLAWQGIGDIYWHYPVLREKPVAAVLLVHGDPRMANTYGPHVLAATQFVGAGRSAFLAFDGTWRWRRYGPEVFYGFWVRMLRYLVEGKLLGAAGRGLILTDADACRLGEAVAVTARAYDRQFNPLDADELTASYRVDDLRREFTLGRASDRAGWFEGSFVPDRTGNYEISLQLPAADPAGPVTVRREVQVVRPNLEILQPQMHRDELVALASMLDQGHYYEIDEADRIPQAVPDRRESATVRSRPRPLWDNGWVLVVLIGLLSGEWVLRKWSRLL